ncbi:MAG TPA: viperin family antiviral radical SAM protein [Planctomycetota bacterium]|nr:viperin family antiviral radical SAM protein [Planctomycetota bacterium]
MSIHPSGVLPVTVNYHVWPTCNYQCAFCFATFNDVPVPLAKDDSLRLVRCLAEAPPIFGRYKIDKLTFAGGEPTLCPHLPDLLNATRERGLVPSLVTNGTGVTADFLKQAAQSLDWVALSIESAREGTNLALGRGFGNHVRNTLAVVERLRVYPHIRIKLNTVVTALNWREDMHWLIRAVRPERWKVLQAVAIAGQNDGKIEALKVTREQFDNFLRRHADLNPVGEHEDEILGSYLMVDPSGRFFGNATGRHVYSRPVLEVGVDAAVRETGWSPDKFVDRGGVYEWRSTSEARR